jgi:hypothetical protein
MGKRSTRIPPALTHGIYSGLGPLPTEDPVKFRKFRKQIFAELGLVGRLEEDIGDEIVCLEWRRKNLFTYDLAERARDRHSSIYAKLDPPQYRPCFPELQLLFPDHKAEPPSPEELAARRQAAAKQAQAELGAALELVKLGDLVAYEFLEKRLAILERLDGMITRAYRKLLYVRGIKSTSSSAAVTQSKPLLGKAA